jgi:hypothetical protein
MEARHPWTGQPIRILRSEPQISSDRTTLLWLRASFTGGFSHRWARYHCVVTEPEAVALVGADKLTGIVLTKDSDLAAWKALFPSIWTETSECLLLAPSSVVDALENDGFVWRHTLILEELHDNYPYIGEPVLATDPVEKGFLALAHVLRMHVVLWSSYADRYTMPDVGGVRMVYDAWKRTMNGRLSVVASDTSDTCIPQTWLIQQYFHHPTLRRAREIRTCLDKNLASPWIDHVVLLNESEFSTIPSSSKLTVRIIGHRLTYYDVLNAIQELVPAGDFAIFANSDIWFNETLAYLWKISLVEARLFLALLRWEDHGDNPAQIFGPRSDSQDTWIVARDTLNFDVAREEFDFPFGQSGCDNALTIAMFKQKCLVVNPAYSIRTMHLHASNVRNYDPKDVLYRRAYLYVDPTPIQSLRVCKDITSAKANGHLPAELASLWAKRAVRRSFPRPIKAMDSDGAAMICRMIHQHESNSGNETPTVYQLHEENIYTPPSVAPPLYHFTSGIFVNYQGLLHSFHDIFVGKHPEWTKAWESAKISNMMPCMYVPSLIALPVSDACKTTLSQWILTYLPKVLAIRRLLASSGLTVPEFLVPQLKDISPFLNDCVWSDSEKGAITLVPIMDTMNYYSDEVWAIPPVQEHSVISSEDVECLRGLLPTPEDSNSGPVIVFCLDSDPLAVCTTQWADSVAEFILPSGWTIRYVSDTDRPATRRKAFMGASWIVGSSASSGLDYMWMAPKGAHVMEFQSVMEPQAHRIHLAGAAGLIYVAGVIRKEPLEIQRQNALMLFGNSLRSFGFQELLDVSRTVIPGVKVPRILVPSGSALNGMWSHSGDTFREMVDIWAERGYVTKEYTETTGFCWWGSLGEVLLYDRPTPRWWVSVPSYQMALFGNCPPPGTGAERLRQSAWGFWPRSPRAVESLVAANKHLKGYHKRQIQSIFLGKIENGVQQEHRTKYDWSKSVEVFSMPIDSTGAPYPYSQSEYLKKLCATKFGLCLPGFGPKCNREIEYFACGVVPIITDGVDMTSYLVPPKEGVHYLRAKTPMDVQRLMYETSPAKWTEMSAAGRDWWKMYASAEGLFRLTMARIEQCRPYFSAGAIPPKFVQ